MRRLTSPPSPETQRAVERRIDSILEGEVWPPERLRSKHVAPLGPAPKVKVPVRVFDRNCRTCRRLLPFAEFARIGRGYAADCRRCKRAAEKAKRARWVTPPALTFAPTEAVPAPAITPPSPVPESPALALALAELRIAADALLWIANDPSAGAEASRRARRAIDRCAEMEGAAADATTRRAPKPKGEGHA